MTDQETTQEPQFSSRTIACAGIPSDVVRMQIEGYDHMAGVKVAFRRGTITIEGSHQDHVEIAAEELQEWSDKRRKEILNRVRKDTVLDTKKRTEEIERPMTEKQEVHGKTSSLDLSKFDLEIRHNAFKKFAAQHPEGPPMRIDNDIVTFEDPRKVTLMEEMRQILRSCNNQDDSGKKKAESEMDPVSMGSMVVHNAHSVAPFKSLRERISQRPQTPTFYVPGLSTALSRDCATYSLIYDSSSIVDYTKVLSEFTKFVQLENNEGVQKRGLLADMASKNMFGNVMFFHVAPPVTQSFVRKSVVEGGVCKVYGRWTPIDDSSINEALEELEKNKDEIAVIPLIG